MKSTCGKYPDKSKVSDEEVAAPNLVKHAFHDAWNYALEPGKA